MAESKNMKIKTFDDLHGVSNELQQLRVGLLEPANLNKSPNKKNKNTKFCYTNKRIWKEKEIYRLKNYYKK